MLAPAFQRRMNQLALVAMLLLLAVPTAGRVLASGSPSSDGVWAQMCTMAGLELVRIAPGDVDPLDSKPDPTPPIDTMGGADCAYCVLLGGLAPPAAVSPLAMPPSWRTAFTPWRLSVPRAFLHPSGLGSRGPPIVL